MRFLQKNFGTAISPGYPRRGTRIKFAGIKPQRLGNLSHPPVEVTQLRELD
jgi:hypothetical protein